MYKKNKSFHYLSTQKFLRDYCCIENNEIILKLTKLSHRNLRKVCLDMFKLRLVTLPFKAIQDEDVNNGNIILVKDVYNNLAPYINPQKVIANEEIYHNFDIFDIDVNFSFLVEESLIVKKPKIKNKKIEEGMII